MDLIRENEFLFAILLFVGDNILSSYSVMILSSLTATFIITLVQI